ncbi:MAG: group I truncated hemoglobin [Gammaproteobacteria bacterium]
MPLLGIACAPPPRTDAPVLTDEPLAAPVEPTSPAEPPSAKSLYERLGGLPAVTAVVDDFAARLQRDPLVWERFEAVNLPRFRAKLIEQVGELTGGPQKYTGIDMRTLHTGMDVTEAEFNAVVADLKATLVAFSVPDREQAELLNALGALKDQIVAQAPTLDDRLGTIEALLGRMDARVNTIAERLDVALTAASTARPPAPVERRPAARARTRPPTPQAWTEEERELVPRLVERYEHASRAVNVGKRRDLA